jgi:hypothetical protein
MQLSQRGPGRLFHGLCALVAAAVLWSATVPGGTIVGFLVALFGIGSLLLVWVVRLGVVAARTRRLDRRFAVAPAGGVVLAVLLVTGAPLHARWAASKADFEGALRSDRVIAEPGEAERLGAYRVLAIEDVGGGTVFTLDGGGFLDGGFAYLPDGPAAVVAARRFESPEFVPLGDGWYRWTSSW